MEKTKKLEKTKGFLKILVIILAVAVEILKKILEFLEKFKLETVTA